MIRHVIGGLTACALISLPVAAQESSDAEMSVAEEKTKDSQGSSVSMPDLQFEPTENDLENYDKYYYFHRRDTSFEEALADIKDCDGYASSLDSGYRYQDAPYPYAGTMAGAAGGLLGNLIASAIVGSSEKRRIRRVNMRRCMGYKGYDRFGLSKDRWEEFNFEEGFSGVADEKREAMLAQQAMVASGPRPTTKDLGL